ncbi:MAG TPA: ATP-binding cassette domain-containing protein [Myxococcota bacterium]|nr:ATP-binding cassette domain-containing protein [Myxococcota bacterium]HQK50797.1 ATP-binding cassette domain-containing protein [Myxococcota bacterium]
MIAFEGLCKAFDGRPVLAGIDLQMRGGEITFVIGSSGTGKSVLMKHAVGLLFPDAGRVILDGEDTATFSEDRWREARRHYAMVFQHPNLFDSMTLRENVALPLRMHRRIARDRALAEAESFLHQVGMASKADLLPAQVGPSERKRVSIARALTLDPDWAILDEPTTGLDPVAARSIDRLATRLCREMGKSVVVVSHDLTSIFTIADRIIFLYKGRVRLDGAPDDFRRSEDPVVRQFITGAPDGPMET